MINDQTQPQPPEGCVYGPWWEPEVQKWYCACKTPSGQIVCRIQLGYLNSWSRVWADDWTCRELLRVAAERDELRKQLADEEGRAVLWLMREHEWVMYCNKETGQWWSELDQESGVWELVFPVTEAKKLGWGG